MLEILNGSREQNFDQWDESRLKSGAEQQAALIDTKAGATVVLLPYVWMSRAQSV